MPVDVVALSPALGAEVRGADLREPPGPELAEVLQRTFAERHLLLFRDQAISGDDQRRVAALFGPLLDESKDGSGVTFVSNARDDGVIGEGPLLFHSDLAFTPEPVLGISLFAVEAEEPVTATRFANGARACRRLSTRTRRLVEGRTALHVYPLTDSRGDRRYRVADLDDGAPRARHPVVLVHPRSGVEILYVSAMQTDSISGLSEDDSEALLGELWGALYADDNVYEHEWHAGDLVVWDNLALQHGRRDVPAGGRRTLRRVPLGRRAVTLRELP